jgi:hypothetical protein
VFGETPVTVKSGETAEEATQSTGFHVFLSKKQTPRPQNGE